MHRGYDPTKLYEDWLASNKPLNEFMQDYGDDPWLFTNEQVFNREKVFDSMPPREDWMRMRGMHVDSPPPPRSQIKDKQSRRTEIEKELDIIRGRIPTPKGYKVDPLRVKELMTELRQLNKEN